MARGGPEQYGEVEWVDLDQPGSSPGSGAEAERIEGGSGPRSSPHRVAVAGAVVVLALGGLALLNHRPGPGAGTTAVPRPAVTSAPDVSPVPTGQTLGEFTSSGRPGPPPSVRLVGRHVLGVQARWELFGWGSSGLVRLQLAAGRLTTTGIPALDSSGPVFLAVGPHSAVVRPLDDVLGYGVADGHSARPLTGSLRGGGRMLPGPAPALVWRETDDPLPSAVLTRLDGTETGVRASTPPQPTGPLVSDGAGYLLYLGIGGVYDVRPAGIDRVTGGWLVASGGGRILAVECADETRCFTVLLGLTDGSRRVVGPGLSPTETIGQVSPDGRWAGIVVQSPGGRSRLEIVDLRSGRVAPVALASGPAVGTGGLVWSPDSRLLFALDLRGGLHVVDPPRASVRSLGLRLPALSELAIRAAAG